MNRKPVIASITGQETPHYQSLLTPIHTVKSYLVESPESVPKAALWATEALAIPSTTLPAWTQLLVSPFVTAPSPNSNSNSEAVCLELLIITAHDHSRLTIPALKNSNFKFDEIMEKILTPLGYPITNDALAKVMGVDAIALQSTEAIFTAICIDSDWLENHMHQHTNRFS